jgi:hypothetical protein
MKKLVLFTMITVFTVLISFSQVTTSSIKGLVTDSANESLPGASIVAIHVPTGTTYGVATNFEGRYNLLNLRVGGPYTITIAFVGYHDKVFNNVYLDLGKTKRLDYQLLEDSEQLEEVVIVATKSGTFGQEQKLVLAEGNLPNCLLLADQRLTLLVLTLLLQEAHSEEEMTSLITSH